MSQETTATTSPEGQQTVTHIDMGDTLQSREYRVGQAHYCEENDPPDKKSKSNNPKGDGPNVATGPTSKQPTGPTKVRQ
jgi:hypothetical protein